jgi:hypothetical protein
MYIAWLAEIKRGPSGLPPAKGAPEVPRAPYPTLRPNGRGDHYRRVTHRRRIPSPQPPLSMLGVSQEDLGRERHRADSNRAVARHRERALVPAPRRAVLLAPVPGSREHSPWRNILATLI